MEFFLAFIIALACLFLIKKYWLSFFVGAGIFIITHFIILFTGSPKDTKFNINPTSISGEIGSSLVPFIISFAIAGIIFGFTRKTKKKKLDSKSLVQNDQVIIQEEVMAEIKTETPVIQSNYKVEDKNKSTYLQKKAQVNTKPDYHNIIYWTMSAIGICMLILVLLKEGCGL